MKYSVLILLLSAGLWSARLSENLDEIPVPAGAGSALPRLTESANGRVLLSWTEPSGGASHALRFAQWVNGGWSRPITVAEGKSWFLNWADFPSVSVNKQVVTAHYLAKSGTGTYAYDVNIRVSPDAGKTWTPSIVPHRDGTETEHGFASLVPRADGRTSVVWLDGRQTFAQHGEYGDLTHAMTLRYAEVDARGELSNERMLDESVCDCCQTTAVMTSDGVVAFYRNRTDDEIRDIWYVREEGGWSRPAPLSDDGWKIQGCPVNGPAAAARDSLVFVAWFTAAGDDNRVNASWSNDAGRTFSAPIRVDEGNPLGRLDVTLMPDGKAAVLWLESKGSEAEVVVRRLEMSGRAFPATVVATVSSSRASGVPQVAAIGEDLLIAWTDAETPGRVRTARIRP